MTSVPIPVHHKFRSRPRDLFHKGLATANCKLQFQSHWLFPWKHARGLAHRCTWGPRLGGGSEIRNLNEGGGEVGGVFRPKPHSIQCLSKKIFATTWRKRFFPDFEGGSVTPPTSNRFGGLNPPSPSTPMGSPRISHAFPWRRPMRLKLQVAICKCFMK